MNLSGRMHMRTGFTNSRRSVFAGLLLAVILSPSLAHAHAGTAASGFLHGLAHPFTGLDHVCAMLAAGIWAAQLGRRVGRGVLLAFALCMVLGVWMGRAGVPIAFFESGIALSLLVLGLLVAAAVRLPLLLAAGMAAVFALFHGYAHGVESPYGASGLEYLLGIALASLLLNVCGVILAKRADCGRRSRWLRYGGVGVALCGGILAMA